jgi:shikimate kinase
VPPSDETAPPPAPRRVVLLGFMCSGKSTVGAALARRLEWGYLDFDVEIERRAGATIRDLVAAEGEDGLRSREAALTVEAAATPDVVLAPGGGWITRPELLHALPPDTLSVWLRVSPDETVRRLMADTIDRPLRDHPDPRGAVSRMMDERLPLYALAHLHLDTDARGAETVAYEIERVVREARRRAEEMRH